MLMKMSPKYFRMYSQCSKEFYTSECVTLTFSNTNLILVIHCATEKAELLWGFHKPSYCPLYLHAVNTVQYTECQIIKHANVYSVDYSTCNPVDVTSLPSVKHFR
jgi:hypothetical protein